MAASDDLEDRLRELRTSLEALPSVSEPPKTTLRILGSAKSEQFWNTLLAYFLDPSQPHGFGADLLKSFLDQVQRETEIDLEYFHRDIEVVTVDTELTSPQDNRLDIVVRAPDAWFVWIEAKVDSSEGTRQTKRYVEDTHLGSEEKAAYPEDGQHYLFLSKEHTPDSIAGEFEDLYWRHVVEAFRDELNHAHGQYPEQSSNQLREFLSTIIRVTSMEEDDFTQIQKEKVRLLSEYRDDIDELLDAAESLRQNAIEEWPEQLLSRVDHLWTDDWFLWDDPGKWGCICHDDWYLDDENLEPTRHYNETKGSTGFRLHFVHLIRNERSFREGELTYLLRSPTNVEMRDEFNRLYNSDRWQERLDPLLKERGITNKGNKRDLMQKTYDVDQSGLPESYYDTLATAFEEHIPVAEVIDEIVVEARANHQDT